MRRGSQDLYQYFSKTLKSLGPFESSPSMAVAVSGGADSLCLAFLAHQWAQENGGTLTALHVDHRLREESSKEADLVKSWLQARGISCVILPWDHQGVLSSIQKKAREARYSLLTNFCKEQGIFHLFLAHHQNDQEETFFYRQSKGSGIEGLAGMSAVEEGPDVRILRPLLGVPKIDLEEFLAPHPFINDPSNTNTKFWRAQFRQNPKQGYSPSFGTERIQLEQTLAIVFARYVQVYPEGYATLSEEFLQNTSPFLQEKVLGKILTTIGGHNYSVRSEVVQRLLKNMPTSAWISAGGCLIRLQGNAYQIIRECGRIQEVQPLKEQSPFLWDGRFMVMPPFPENAFCQALGEEGWQYMKNRPLLPKVPAKVFYALPAFFDKKGKLISLAKAVFTPQTRLLRSLWLSAV